MLRFIPLAIIIGLGMITAHKVEDGEPNFLLQDEDPDKIIATAEDSNYWYSDVNLIAILSVMSLLFFFAYAYLQHKEIGFQDLLKGHQQEVDNLKKENSDLKIRLGDYEALQQKFKKSQTDFRDLGMKFECQLTDNQTLTKMTLEMRRESETYKREVGLCRNEIDKMRAHEEELLKNYGMLQEKCEREVRSLTTLNQQYSVVIGTMNKDMSEYSARVDKLEGDLGAAQNEIYALKHDNERLQNEVQSVQFDNQRLNVKLLDSKDHNSAILLQLDQEQKELKRTSQSKEHMKIKYDSKVHALQRDCEKLRTQKTNLENKLENQVKNYENTLDNKRTLIHELKNEKDGLLDQIAALTKECVTLKCKVEDQANAIGFLDAKNQANESTIEAMKADSEKSGLEKVEIQCLISKITAEYEDFKIDYQNMEQQVDQKRFENDKLVQEVEALKEEIAGLRNELSERETFTANVGELKMQLSLKEEENELLCKENDNLRTQRDFEIDENVC